MPWGSFVVVMMLLGCPNLQYDRVFRANLDLKTRQFSKNGFRQCSVTMEEKGGKRERGRKRVPTRKDAVRRLKAVSMPKAQRTWRGQLPSSNIELTTMTSYCSPDSETYYWSIGMYLSASLASVPSLSP
jgi:hypothetical protein